MANKGVFFIPDIEHDGDVQYYKSLVLDNGGEIIKVVCQEKKMMMLISSLPHRLNSK